MRCPLPDSVYCPIQMTERNPASSLGVLRQGICFSFRFVTRSSKWEFFAEMLPTAKEPANVCFCG